MKSAIDRVLRDAIPWLVVLLAFSATAPAQDPPVDEPVANPPEAPAKAVRVPANQNARAPVLKPANMNQNPNAVMRNQAGRNAFVGVDIGPDRAIIESMSRERLAAIEPPSSLLKLLPSLDDPSFSVREATSQKLLDRSFRDEAIWAVLDRFQLSEEARGRLLTVAYRRVMERPRGALGIRMGTATPDPPGVVIQATLPGMPAEKFLKAGDVIEEIDGHPVQTNYDLVESIENYSPGKEVKIKLRRPERDAQGRPIKGEDGEMVLRPIDLSMPLGNAEDLDKADPGDPRPAQNMQLQRRVNEAKLILQHFRGPQTPMNNPLPADRP